MAIEKLTERANEALTAAIRVAEDNANQLVEPEHLLLALLASREGIVEPLLDAAGARIDLVRAAAEQKLERRPQVRGGQVEQRVSPGHRPDG